MRSRQRLELLLLAAVLIGTACAPKRPVLYPNETVQQVGWDGAQRDVDECLKFAEAYGLGADPAARTAGSTAVGGALGGAAGAAGGAVRGSAGSRAGAGAAAGASVGFLRGLFRWRDPDPMQQRFVQICLARQGYQIIGWR